MDDRLLASRAASGDLDSFGQLFDRYVSRVYDFAWRTLRDAEGAEAVTRGIFERAAADMALAGRAPSFAAWLFGITHAEILARAESIGVVPIGPAPSAEEAFGAFGVPDPIHLNDPVVVGGDPRLADLVWESIASLGPRDYAMLDLDQRQHLDATEIGHIIASAKASTQTIVTRMRKAASGVIVSYIVARRGADACADLRGIVAAHAMPPYGDEARRAVQAHMQSCATCGSARDAIADPMPIFASFATIAAPFAFKGDLWSGIARAWRGEAASFSTTTAPRREPRQALAGGAGAGGSGRPPTVFGTGGSEWTQNRMLLFGGAALGLVVFAFAIGAIFASAFGGGGNSDSGAPPATRTATKAAGTTGTPANTASPGVSVQTATPDLNPTATSTPEDTATPAPTSTPAPPTAKPATATNTPRPGPTTPPTKTPRPGTPTRTPVPSATIPTIP